jgi:sulfur-oxidizing protein SoxB
LISRREVLQVGAAAAAICAANGLGPVGRVAAQQRLTEAELLRFDALGNVTLLHVADLHAQIVPVCLREPSVNLGAGAAKGVPPHVTGADFLARYGIAPGSAAAYALTAQDFSELAKAYGRIGWLDRAAAVVKAVRAERGDKVLFLDGATVGKVRSARCAQKPRTWSIACDCSSPTP